MEFGAHNFAQLLIDISKKQWELDGRYRNSVLFTSASFPYLGADDFARIGIEQGIANAIRLDKEHYTIAQESQSLAGLLLRKIQANGNAYLTEYISGHRAAFSAMEKVTETIASADYKISTEDELVNAFRHFLSSATNVVPWFWSLDFLSEAVDTHLRSRLADTYPAWSTQQLDTFIAEVSYIAKNHAEDDEADELIALSSEQIKDETLIRGLHKRYAWLSIDIWEGNPYTFIEYAEHVRDVYMKRAELVAKKAANLVAAQNSEKVIAGIPDHSLSELLHVVRELIFLKTERMDMYSRSWANVLGLVLEIAKRLVVSKDEFMLCTIDEVVEGLNGHFPAKDELASRAAHVGCLRIDNTVHYITGQEVEEAHAAINKPIEINLQELRGSIAYGGVARGVARVVLTSKDIAKINKGDILVSQATNSNYDPAFALIAGVVTDEGGVLCHSAILAREFKIPAVIATKTATQLIQDGDEIEVDANQGIVRILSRFNGHA
jgi:phosphohistidine swiveling domain-containing protein